MDAFWQIAAVPSSRSGFRVQCQTVAFGIEEMRDEAAVVRQLRFLRQYAAACLGDTCQHRIDTGCGIEIQHRAVLARYERLAMHDATDTVTVLRGKYPQH